MTSKASQVCRGPIGRIKGCGVHNVFRLTSPRNIFCQSALWISSRFAFPPPCKPGGRKVFGEDIDIARAREYAVFRLTASAVTIQYVI